LRSDVFAATIANRIACLLAFSLLFAITEAYTELWDGLSRAEEAGKVNSMTERRFDSGRDQ